MMDLGWVTSQAVIGVVVIVLMIGGLAFFALVEPRRGAPSGGTASGAHGRDTGGTDVTATLGDGGAAASVFETEPCWVSLVHGKPEPAAVDRDPVTGG